MARPPVPFKTPVDYFIQALKTNPENIDSFPLIQRALPEWTRYDNDLHVYPYTDAVPAMMSMGCRKRCSFCPTAKVHRGKIYFGDPEKILPFYNSMNVHFMDENFFMNDLRSTLPMLRRFKIYWLAMVDYSDAERVFNEYGEDYLYDCGMRVLEIGLENIDLMRKVKGEGLKAKRVEILYLNMTFMPGETKETIKHTADWMKRHSLKHPIHFYAGLWFAPGQYFYIYDDDEFSEDVAEPEIMTKEDGVEIESPEGRTMPTYIPNSFLSETVEIRNVEKVNYYSNIVYNFRYFPKYEIIKVRDFIFPTPDHPGDFRAAMWLAVGLRTGGII